MSEQEAINILENEIKCIARKTAFNCTNCDTCDLVMLDAEILCAIDMAQSALRAQQERENPQPLTCDGCKYRGKYGNEVEYGIPSPCTICKRTAHDNYEPKGEHHG